MITNRLRLRHRRTLAWKGWVTTCLTALLLAAPIKAAPGDLDPTFGSGGKITTDFGFGSARIRKVVVQGDGKILVAGDSDNQSGIRMLALARYTSTGTLDPSFGSGGKVTTVINRGARAGGMAVQNDGRIIVVGTAAESYHASNDAFNDDMVLARYTSTGALDTSFGIGGKVTMDFSGTYFTDDSASSVAVQSDGKIIVVGTVEERRVSFPPRYFAVVRCTERGELDASFGEGGKVIATFGQNSGASDVAIQNDGKILVAGDRNFFAFALARYTETGAPDSSFGVSGNVVTLFSGDAAANSMTVQSDGKIVLAGVANNKMTLARYTGTGALDPDFGTGGKVIADFDSDPSSGSSVALQSDGKIVVVGCAGNGPNGDFAVARFETTGAMDTSFGTGGKVITPVSSDYNYAASVAIQSDGKIVAAGQANGDFALVRYEGVADAANARLSALALSAGVLDPVFAAGTTSYSAAVSNATATLTVTPTAAFAGASIDVRINGGSFIAVASGSPSAALPLNVGANAVEVKVTAQNGTTTRTYTATVTRATPGSTEASLASLALSAGTLSPTFAATTNSYTTTLGNATSTITVTPTAANAGASIEVRINGGSFTPVGSGSPSSALALNVGMNIVEVKVTAQDLVTTKTCTVAVMRAAAGSSDADLAALEFIGVIFNTKLAPPFVSTTTSYQAGVNHETTGSTVQASTVEPHASIKLRVNGSDFTSLDSGSWASVHPLNFGANSIEVIVTAQDLVTTKTYTVAVTRLSSPNADKGAPQVKITAPTQSAVDGAFIISGTVKEDFALADFRVALNGVPLTLDAPPLFFAPKTAVPWSVSGVVPENGPNVITVTAIDTLRRIRTVTKSVTYVNPAMASRAGTYTALMMPAGRPTPHTSGLVTLTVTTTGAFTGKVLVSDEAVPIRGVLQNDGAARFKPDLRQTVTVYDRRKPRSGGNIWLGDLALSVSGAGVLNGTLSQESVQEGSPVAQFEGGIAPYSKANPAPPDLVAAYNVVFPSKEQTPTLGHDLYPQGAGFARVTVTRTGAVSASGWLADGSKFSASGALRADGTVPLFAFLKETQGTMSGELALASLADSDITGADFLWCRPENPVATHYPLGWADGIRVDAIGTRYTKPASLDFGQGPADPVGGNVLVSFDQGLVAALILQLTSIDPVTGAVRLIAPENHAFTLRLGVATGLFDGTILHTDGKTVVWRGILINKGANRGGFGYFLSPVGFPAGMSGQGGVVFIDPSLP